MIGTGRALRTICALLLLFVAAPALGQTTAQASLAIGGKIVPLPPGTWRVLYLAAEPGRTTEGRLPTTMHRAVLVQEHAGQAAAVIIVSAAAEVGAVWNPHGICVDANAIHRDIQSAMRGSLDCRGQVVLGSGRGANTAAYLNALYDEGVRRPGWIPPRWISVQIIQSQQLHFLSVEYRFAPTVFAPAAAQTPNWNEGSRTRAANDFVAQLAAFSVVAREQLQRGLYGRQPTAALPWPFPPAASAPSAGQAPRR